MEALMLMRAFMVLLVGAAIESSLASGQKLEPRIPIVVIKNKHPSVKASLSKSNCSTEKSEIQCNVGNKCIKSQQICDGYADCPNKWDETNCEWCNRTFSNEFSNRILIQSPIKVAKGASSFYSCYYKVVNVKKNTLTGIRMRKFSVGYFNNRTKKCELSWIEIYESDYDESASNEGIRVKKNNIRNVMPTVESEKVTFDDRNLTSLKYSIKTNGRFCGTIHNMLTSFYASKRFVYIKYTMSKNNSMKSPARSSLNDSFEFEVAFYDKQSASTLQSGSLVMSNSGVRLNYGVQMGKDLCSRVFEGCVSSRSGRFKSSNDSTVCIIASPGFPGVYPKNSKCQYYVRGSYLDEPISRGNEKLILVNENLQLDANICHFEPSNKSLFTTGQLASSYFCDSGLRTQRESCSEDFINIYLTKFDASSSSSKSQRPTNKQSLILLKQLCGMGRLPKIVISRKVTSVSIEMLTSSDGLFANSGFLFYALSPSVYFSSLVENRHSSSYRSTNVKGPVDDDYNRLESALKRVERWQVDSCDSDMNECTIVVTDESMMRFTSGQWDKFRVGYLFGMNQYQPNGFTLKYILRTKVFNTIAIYIEKYDPNSGGASSSNTDPCLINHLSIETSSRFSSADYTYYDDSSYDYQSENIAANYSSPTMITFKPVNKKKKFQINSKSSQYPNQKQSIVKLCEKTDYNNTLTKFFLIKTGNSRPAMSKSRSDLVVSYFNLYSTLSESARLNDFRISYEFVNFDWHAYQEGSLCNFVYNGNYMESSSGVLTSPKSRIFFTKSSQSGDQQDGDYLRCRYRIMARQNQYIRLTVKSVDLDIGNQHENIFFTTSDKTGTKTQLERCSKIPSKLIIKDSQQPWSDVDLNRVDMGDENLDELNVDEENSNVEDSKSSKMEIKLCLCRVQNGSELAYISKFDFIEIEYKVKLEDHEPTKMNNFVIKYEFIDRDCSRLIKTSPKSNYKGKLMYRPFDSKLFGVQQELLQFVNKTKRDLFYYDSIPSYLSPEDRYKREIENLNYILIDNLNFACKFYISAPINTFIHTQFRDLLLPSNCQMNQVKLYSNFTRAANNSLDRWASLGQGPFLRLCSNGNDNSIDDEKKQNMIVAQFFDDSIANSSFTCVDPKSKICFLTSELNDELNLYKKLSSLSDRDGQYFYNSLIVEIVSNRVHELEFDIKYNFFKIDMSVSQELANSSGEKLFSSSKRNCDFKCFKPNRVSGNTSWPLKICLDESLVCDGEIHCMFNNLDEINCPVKLNSKTILIVLCSLFMFTSTVLLFFYLFRKYSKYFMNEKKPNPFFKNKSKSDSIRYSKASQLEN